MQANSRRLIIGLAALAWLAIAVSIYYVGHKPLSPELARQLGGAIWQTGVGFGVVSVGGGLGARLLPRLSLRPLAALALQAALGLGLLSLGFLFIGSWIGIKTWLSWAILLALAALFWRQMLGWWRLWRDLPALFRESDYLGKSIAVGAAGILFFTWTAALAPPVKFDALVYHLTIPSIYQSAGKIIYIPENMFWGMPQLGEMLYTWGISLAGVECAAALGWMAGLLALLGLIGYGAQRLGARAAWVSLAALLSGVSLASSLAWGYIDWWVVLFGLGFFVALDCWRSFRTSIGQDFGVEASAGLVSNNSFANRLKLRLQEPNLILAGCYCGLALGTKYTAGILLVAGFWLTAWSQRWCTLRQIFASLRRFAVPALLFSLPWWIKNILSTGNPFYPFFFPSGTMDRFRLDFYQIPVWGQWQDAIFLPWRATWSGIEGAYGYNASIGPLLLALGLLAWLSWASRTPGQRETLNAAAWVGFVGVLVWILAARLSGYLIQSRLYWSIFPALAFLAGGGFLALDDLKLPGIRTGRVAGALVLFVFALTVLEVGVSMLKQGSLQLLLSLDSRQSYLEKNLGWYAPAVQAVHSLPPGSKAIMLWEPRSLYCVPRCSPDEGLDRWLGELRAGQTPAAILQKWRQAGYTHLLYNRFGAGFVEDQDSRYLPADWQALEYLLAQLPQPADFGPADFSGADFGAVDFGAAYQLYSLGP